MSHTGNQKGTAEFQRRRVDGEERVDFAAIVGQFVECHQHLRRIDLIEVKLQRVESGVDFAQILTRSPPSGFGLFRIVLKRSDDSVWVVILFLLGNIIYIVPAQRIRIYRPGPYFGRAPVDSDKVLLRRPLPIGTSESCPIANGKLKRKALERRSLSPTSWLAHRR